MKGSILLDKGGETRKIYDHIRPKVYEHSICVIKSNQSERGKFPTYSKCSVVLAARFNITKRFSICFFLDVFYFERSR